MRYPKGAQVAKCLNTLSQFLTHCDITGTVLPDPTLYNTSCFDFLPWVLKVSLSDGPVSWIWASSKRPRLMSCKNEIQTHLWFDLATISVCFYWDFVERSISYVVYLSGLENR